MDISEIYMTVEEAARALDVTPRTVFSRIESGVFKRHKEGDRTFLRRSEIEEYINNLPTQ